MDTKELILDRIASAQRQLHEIHAALDTDAPIAIATARQMEAAAKAATALCRDIAKLAEILQRPYTNA